MTSGAVRRVMRLARAGVALVCAPMAALVMAAAVTPLPSELRQGPDQGSVRVVDRDGALLREVRADDGARARWVRLDEVGDTVAHAVVAAEDARFFLHPGVDPVAVVRALLGAARYGKLVSGASTLTMQLARTLRPHPRSLRGKLGEMALALRIEASVSKRAILEQYVNRVSFGPNLRGVAAASQAFFGKQPASLSAGEAALVAGMARGPSVYDLAKRPELARARRDRVVQRMVNDGYLSPHAATRARAEPLPSRRAETSFGAPHLVAALIGGELAREQPGLSEVVRDASAVTRIWTTVDDRVQRAAERQAFETVEHLRTKGVSAASVLVVDNASGDVLAYVGSPDFDAVQTGGQNDGVRAQRQPGSTLKPFVYELAMERLGFDPATMLPDVEMHLDVGVVHDYAPRDYDGRTRGPVRLRDALGNSLNIPAVWVAHELGGEALLGRLHELGFASLSEDADYYGPALALGDGEVSLLELTRAYVALAGGGVAQPLRFVSRLDRVGETVELAIPSGKRVMPERLADLIVDILKDHNAREASFGERTVLDFPFDVAAKTGTSKGFRDNWTVGFSRAFTVGVWVGNFAGEPMTNVSGITGAGPLFHAVLEATEQIRGTTDAGRAARLPVEGEQKTGLERVEVCALSGELAGPDCPHRVGEWRPVDGAASVCTMHDRVRVDRRNGKRAGPSCPADDVEERVYERFPRELVAWAGSVGRPTPPVDWSPLCPGTDARAAEGDAQSLGIAYPLDGARFVLDPDTPRAAQRLDVQVLAPPSTTDVRLFVDRVLVGHSSSPFRLSWQLEPGDHELEVSAAYGPPARVVVHVRASE